MAHDIRNRSHDDKCDHNAKNKGSHADFLSRFVPHVQPLDQIPCRLD
jgi:hypothetical protein